MNGGTVIEFRPRADKSTPGARVRPDLDDLNQLMEVCAGIVEMMDACGHVPEFREALRVAGRAVAEAGKLGLADMARYTK
jgi:hypothetical protein